MMLRFFRKPYRWAAVFTAATVLFTTFTLLDTFVIPRAGTGAITYSGSSAISSDSDLFSSLTSSVSSVSSAASPSVSNASSSSGSSQTSVITSSSYSDDAISITIDTISEYGTMIYIADIRLSSIDYLKTAFADDTYGRNIAQKTSVIAENCNAILAINGDYCGFRSKGFVLRNNVLYRDTARSDGDDEALVIDASGDFSIIRESSSSALDLLNRGVLQIFSFGPALVDGGVIAVEKNTEISGKSMVSNPRTAIGQISGLHYLFVVSDGRTSESAGLSLYQLAEVCLSRGCSVAYNLDGGGSSTIWFNGSVINKPTTDGRRITERSVSDIVYIGY